MAAYIFSAVICFVMPVAFLIYFAASKKNLLKPYLLGALTFTVFQLILRIPLLQYVLPNMNWYWTMSNVNPVLYILFLGITAALFENIGRYIIMKLFMKKQLSYENAVAFGLGHGGIEALILVGINVMASLIVFQSAANAFSVLLGTLERIFAVIFHVTASLLVMKSIKTANIFYLIIAVFLHALMDSGILLLANMGINFVLLEIILALFSVVMLITALYLKKNFNGGNA